MALFNYSGSPYLATPQPPTVDYYQPPQPFHPQQQQQQQPPQAPYSYPPPQKQFLAEEFTGNSPYLQQQPPYQNQRPPQNRQQQQNLPPTYKKLSDQPIKTRVHAVIDYDYEDEEEQFEHLAVTPILGPIFIKNGSVPVVPLYSHPVLQNGTFVQIPILWTALSIALGVEIRGEYIRGVPCIKRNQQLYCPRAGNSYPLERIELFIDENKALMKRMYGEFDMPDYENRYSPGAKRKRSTKPGVPDVHFDPGPEPLETTGEPVVNKNRSPRQNFRNNQSSESGRIDACESKIEIVTPYWASNSAGKVRAIVNTQHFEQAIHQEVCAKSSTNRCKDDCGCEQKYKWHRLLAYDPDNDCKGIFMDWFLFPSCCVCRCSPN